MAEATYKEENGGYAVYHGAYRMFEMDEVAFLINKSGYLLVNHGAPREVNARHRQILAAAAKRPELGDVADTLVVITGRFDVDEINRIIRRETTCRQLYNRLELEAARQVSDVLSQFALQPQ